MPVIGKKKKKKGIGVRFRVRVVKVNKLSYELEGKTLFVQIINEYFGKAKKAQFFDTPNQVIEESLAFWPPKSAEPYDFTQVVPFTPEGEFEPCHILMTAQTIDTAAAGEDVHGVKKEKHKKKGNKLGIMVKLDLEKFAQDGANKTENFLVPGTKKPKDGDVPAYAIQITVKSEWVSYMNRPIEPDRGQEGVPVEILGGRYVFTGEEMPEEDEDDDDDDDEEGEENDSSGGDGAATSGAAEKPSGMDKADKEAKREKEQKKLEEKARIAREKEEAKLAKKQAKEEEKKRKEEEKKKKEEAKSHRRSRSMSVSGGVDSDEAVETKAGEEDSMLSAKEKKKLAKKRRHSVALSEVDVEEMRKEFSGGENGEAESGGLLLSKSGPQRAKVPVEFQMELLEMSELPVKAEGQAVTLQYRVGQSKKDQQAGEAVCSNGMAVFDPPCSFTFVARMTRDSARQTFEDESLGLSVRALKEGGKAGKSLCKALLNLADYANNGTEATISVNTIGSQVPSAIRLRLKARWVTEESDSGGKVVPFDPSKLKDGKQKKSKGPRTMKGLLKVEFMLHVLRLRPMSSTLDGHNIAIEFDAGKKKKAQEEESSVGRSLGSMCIDGEAFWEEQKQPVPIVCHLNMNPETQKLSSRKVKATVVARGQDKSGKGKLKVTKVGKVSFDISEFGADGYNASHSFPLVGSKTGTHLELQVQCKWIKYEGKLLKAVDDSTADSGAPASLSASSSMTSSDEVKSALELASSQSRKEVDLAGQHYQLETCDEMSELSQISSTDMSDSDEDATEVYIDEEGDDKVDHDPFTAENEAAVRREAEEIAMKRAGGRGDDAHTEEQPEMISPAELAVAQRDNQQEASDALIAALRGEVESLSAEKEDLLTQQRHLMSSIHDQQEELDSLREDARELSKLRTRLAEADSAANGSEEEAILREQLASTQSALDDSKSTVKRVQSERTDLESQLIQAQAENESLRREAAEGYGKMQQLREENEELRRKVEDARAASVNAAITAAAVGGAASSPSMDSKRWKKTEEKLNKKIAEQQEEIAVLQRKLEKREKKLSKSSGGSEGVQQRLGELDAIMRTILLSAPLQYNDANTPMLSCNLHSFLSKRRVFETGNTALMNDILDAMQAVCKISGTDNVHTAYWLSSGLHLLNLLQQRKELGMSGTVAEDGVPLIDSPPPAEGTPIGLSFEAFLNQFIRNAYLAFVGNFDRELSQLLEPAVFQQDIAIMESDSPVPFKLGHVSAEDVVQCIEKHLKYLKQNNVCPMAIKQCLHHVMYFISSYLFRQVLERKELCKPHIGFQMKMAISVISAWVLDQHEAFHTCGGHLEVITQAANVLALATNVPVFADADSIGEAFNHLNIAQVRKLLQQYTPDSIAPAPIPREVLETVSRVCQSHPNWRDLPLLLPESFEEFILVMAQSSDAGDSGSDDGYC